MRWPVGRPVVVTERRHPNAYEEGVIQRSKLDGSGRIRIHLEGMPGDSWVAIEPTYFAPLPQVGECRRWASSYRGTLHGLGCFTVMERREDRLFTIRYDEALYRDGVASAAELAKFSDLYTAPDGADDGTVPATRAPVEPPRHPLPAYGPLLARVSLEDVRAVTAPRVHAANLDTLRDIVLEAALTYEAGPVDGEAAIDLRDAVRVYRKARDS